MCDFPSWIEDEDGNIHYLTDKDINKYLRLHPDKTWKDMIGHSAIKEVLGVEGKHKEGFPCPPLPFNEMKKMMEVGGYKTIFVNADGDFHREDGPALEYVNGDKFWYLNGKMHREDGPAVAYADGDKEWYLNGRPI